MFWVQADAKYTLNIRTMQYLQNSENCGITGYFTSKPLLYLQLKFSVMKYINFSCVIMISKSSINKDNTLLILLINVLIVLLKVKYFHVHKWLGVFKIQS